MTRIRSLKKIRVAVAVLVFALFLLTFLGHGKTSEVLSETLLFFQFVPSLIQFTLMPITPPGSSGIVRFTKTCTACHLCVSACQTNVITPAFLEYGVSGLLQPRMNYLKGHCDFECNTCGHVCPTGAISPLLLRDKKRVQIGKAFLNKKECIVHVKRKHCGACGEACPTHAIIPAEKGLVLFPTMKIEYCIGCGACERACPTKPRKAITVTANPVHAKAGKYIPKPLPVLNYQDEEFPF